MSKKGNFTQVPNNIMDGWMKHLKEVELRVLLAIIRKTLGFHKLADKIAISQLQEVTGSSKGSIIIATKSLSRKGVIRINKGHINEYVVDKSVLLNPPGQKIRPKGSENQTSDVQKSDTQKKDKENEINYSRLNDISKIVEKWNMLFEMKMTIDNKKCNEMINNALDKFDMDFILIAMIGRDMDDFYKGKHAHLKNIPTCFFPFPETIAKDNQRFYNNLHTYNELTHLTTTGQVKMDDFAPLEKNQWLHKKYLKLLNDEANEQSDSK